MQAYFKGSGDRRLYDVMSYVVKFVSYSRECFLYGDVTSMCVCVCV